MQSDILVTEEEFNKFVDSLTEKQKKEFEKILTNTVAKIKKDRLKISSEIYDLEARVIALEQS